MTQAQYDAAYEALSAKLDDHISLAQGRDSEEAAEAWFERKVDALDTQFMKSSDGA
jgi:hypothetical protein